MSTTPPPPPISHISLLTHAALVWLPPAQEEYDDASIVFSSHADTLQIAQCHIAGADERLFSQVRWPLSIVGRFFTLYERLVCRHEYSKQGSQVEGALGRCDAAVLFF